MKTKHILAILLTGALSLTTACSTTATAEVSTQAAAASVTSTAASSQSGDSNKEVPPEAPNDQNMITGKITVISEDEITLAKAITPERGENSGENKPGGGTPQEGPSGQLPERPEMKEGEAPSGSESQSGAPGGDRGRGMGRNTEFSDETVTYAISDGVVIAKGMGDSEETISISDLVVDDIVRVELNGSGQAAAIRLMDMDGNGQPPQPPDGTSSTVG